MFRQLKIDAQQVERQIEQIDLLQSACTNCGLCLEGCVTYQATGWEHESPRGRIHLAKEFIHGRITPDSSTLQSFDRCLGCHACEKLCPQHVEYSKITQLVQEIRQKIYPQPLSINEKKGFAKVKQFNGFPGKKWMMNALSLIQSFQIRNGSSKINSKQPVLAINCHQDLNEHELIQQTMNFMQRLGVSMQVSRQQPCCGALFNRFEHVEAKQYQQKCVNQFTSWKTSETYFLSQRCQQWSGTPDFYNWIKHLVDMQQLTLKLSKPQVIYYQPYCAAKQDAAGILLNQIEGLEVRLVNCASACCGGYQDEASIYPEQAKQWLSPQLQGIPKQSTIVVTSDECAQQWLMHAQELEIQVKYPIQILEEAQFK